MATLPRRLTAPLLLVCAVFLISATSTALDERPMQERDHQRIVDELQAIIHTSNYLQNLEITTIRERQNNVVERVKILEDRFWFIIIGILGTLVSSIIGAMISVLKINSIHTMSAPQHEHRESWDGHERRRHVRAWPEENDRRNV
jgi:hypothetical protein